MDPSHSEPRSVNRVALACIQCRNRHVKCDAVQPVCTRCDREGKECNYQKSRRGGLDKAALARRRLALQQQAERCQKTQNNVDQDLNQVYDHHSSTDSSQTTDLDDLFPSIPRFSATNLDIAGSAHSTLDGAMAFSVNLDRLLDLYYEYFNPSLPIVLPFHYFCRRRRCENHGLQDLLLAMQWIGSVHAPWAPSEPYYERALEALRKPTLPRNGFSIQALLILAIAQHHSDLKIEARMSLDSAIAIALEIGLTTQEFAQQCGEGNPVLEESWRRTYYLLHHTDQHFSVVVSSPMFTLRDVPNVVDLPCDDKYYELGVGMPYLM